MTLKIECYQEVAKEAWYLPKELINELQRSLWLKRKENKINRFKVI